MLKQKPLDKMGKAEVPEILAHGRLRPEDHLISRPVWVILQDYLKPNQIKPQRITETIAEVVRLHIIYLQNKSLNQTL